MPRIYKLMELIGLSTPPDSEPPYQLIERLNKRLIHARENGASCIVIGPRDGFTLYMIDGQPKALPVAVKDTLTQLDKAGYVFVKDRTPNQSHCLRVYFRSPPACNRVSLTELLMWPSAEADAVPVESPHANEKEAKILVEGVELTDAQSMAVRVALTAFIQEMRSDGPGDDQVGKTLSAGHIKNSEAVLALIHGQS